MEYNKIYHQIIKKAKLRQLSNPIYGFGYENHHIIPRSRGGSDLPTNLVLLTFEEHFICHKLLKKIYPNCIKMRHAFNEMRKGLIDGKIIRFNKGKEYTAYKYFYYQVFYEPRN